MTPDSLSNPSQLICRNKEWFECEHLLMAGMPADDLGRHLVTDKIVGKVYGLSRDYATYRRLKGGWDQKSQELHLEFAPSLSPENNGTFDGILIFLQKSKALMDFWLDMALPRLTAGGRLWLVGENKEGIKSWKKRLKNHFSEVKIVDNARHCVLLEGSEPVKSKDVFSLDDRFQRFDFNINGQSVKVSSLPGVFSHGRLDRGTRVLLETLGSVPKGRILDFGCGAGTISAFAGRLSAESHFTLVDSDALALASSRKTLLESHLEHFDIQASDGLSDVTGQFDLILSNPPFHQGVKTHYEVTEQFLTQACQHLNKGGELRIVANSFLRYQPIIEKSFGHCETMIVDDGFTVHRAYKN